MRSAKIRLTSDGYVVDLYEMEGESIFLRETRSLPGKSIYYAEDVKENWENGIIKVSSSD